MNIELLKFINRKIRILNDITHQEYDVVGANWATDCLLFFMGNRLKTVHHSQVVIIEGNNDEEE